MVRRDDRSACRVYLWGMEERRAADNGLKKEVWFETSEGIMGARRIHRALTDTFRHPEDVIYTFRAAWQ
jgi:hypothetical protein